jgi:hypothetical protein
VERPGPTYQAGFLIRPLAAASTWQTGEIIRRFVAFDGLRVQIIAVGFEAYPVAD